MHVRLSTIILVSIVLDVVKTSSTSSGPTSGQKPIAAREKKDIAALILTPVDADDAATSDHKFRKCTSTGCDHENNKHVFRFCGSAPCPKEPGDGQTTKTRDVESVRSTKKVWGPWGRWSACSATCGLGKMTRWRHCVAGNCAFGEKEAQIKTCLYRDC